MSGIADLLKPGWSRRLATVTPATFATDEEKPVIADPVATVTPVTVTEPQMEEIAVAAVGKLRANPSLLRAVQAEPDESGGYRIGYANRMPDGTVACCVIAVPQIDFVRLLRLLERQ